MANNEIIILPIESIAVPETNLHIEYSNDDAKSLAKNVTLLNMDEPIIVRPNGDKFEIVSGEKVVLAAIAAGFKYLPVIAISSINDYSLARQLNGNNYYTELIAAEKKIKNLMKYAAENRREEVNKLKVMLSPLEREHLERVELKEIQRILREKKKQYALLKARLEVEVAASNSTPDLPAIHKKNLEKVVYEKRLPRNKLNNLNGKQWIKFTKTWFVHNPPPRKGVEILHPAKFPETMVAEFIEFFTKEGQRVLDPFAGIGSTLVACDMTNRIGIGIEIEEKWAKIAKMRSKQTVIVGDVREIDKMNLPIVDFVITSPPYWKQLKNAKIRQKPRDDIGIPTDYSSNPRNLGNIERYEDFLNALRDVFDKVYNIVKFGGYLVIITNNVFLEGKLFPLAFDTAIYLSRYGRWTLKDEKIWLQDNKQLLPLGIYNEWIGNRCHEYCLIFRKET